MSKVKATPTACWLILELSEYVTVRNRGLLHALPTSRYVALDSTYNDWYRALPIAWNNGKHFVVKLTSRPVGNEPLRFQDIESRIFYSLQPEVQATVENSFPGSDFLSTRLGQVVISASPFIEMIKKVRFAQRNFPFGLAIITLADYEALVSREIAVVSGNNYLPADVSLEEEAWRRCLPDFEGENYALVVKLRQATSVGSDIPSSSLELSQVYPLSKQGADILRIEKPDIQLLNPIFEEKFVGPVLLERAISEHRYNAEQLASLALVKPAKIQFDTAQLVEAWDLRQKRMRQEQVVLVPNPACKTFWDYLVDYDRTGEVAQRNVTTNSDRGYLQDLKIILGRYLKRTRLASGQLSEDELTQIIGVWNKFADDDQLDTNAFKVLVAKSPKSVADAIRRVSESLAIKEKIQPLIVGFLYLRLRRELGDLEQELTLRKLQENIKQADKYNSELYLTLYALGLIFPFKTFVELYDENAEISKNVRVSMLNPIDSENQSERKSETLDELPPSAPLQIGISYNL